MAAQGFGIAIASTAAIRSAVTAGRLVGVPLSPRLHTPLEVILLKDKFRSRLVNTFADFVTEEIGRMCATEKV
jgi:DNA-binding transcriptional LysR family regulator